MSDMLKRKIEEQNKLHNRMQELVKRASDEDRDFTAEERAEWDDKLEPRIAEVSKDIERLEAAAKLEVIDYRQVIPAQTALAKPEDAAEDRDARYTEAFGRFMRGGMDHLSLEQRSLMLENRAQGTDIPADGGYLVPDGFRQTMTETMKAFGGLLNLANVITTSTGNTLQWPTNDSTSQVGAILAENTQITEMDVTFGTKAIGAYTYSSKLVRVSLQLLQDNVFDLNTWLPRKLGERIGRAVASDLINGTGVGEPEGILPNSTAFGGTAIGVAAFNANTSGAGYNAMIDLEHSVDPAYRASGNNRFLFNDATLATLRKFKDGDGRPLWLPVPVPGMPATINGVPYSIDQAMPNVADTAKPILYGDFRAGYLVRQVQGVQMVRLAERWADFLQIGYFGFSRLDAVPDDTSAVRALNITGA